MNTFIFKGCSITDCNISFFIVNALIPAIISSFDREKAHRVAKKLRSGCVYINGNAADAGTPFGGYRQSGNGREGGVWGLTEYLEVKTVTGWKN